LWRNTVKFDPTKRVGPSGEASSYEEAALLPAAKALGAAAAAAVANGGEKVSVDFSLGGEQGVSVFTYPRNYQAMIPRLKQAMIDAAGGEEQAKQKLKTPEFGISLNWGKACGCVFVEEQDPLIYNSTFPDRLNRWRKAGGESKVDLNGVRSLLEAIDWLGTSGYASLPADAGAGNEAGAKGASALEASWDTLAYEMALMGLPLQDLVLSKGKRMIFSEQGVGGCDRKGNVAPDAAWVAKHPFLGLWPNHGGFSSAANGSPPPVNPWKNQAYAKLRRQIYNYFGDYALAGGGPGWRLDAAYVWSAGEESARFFFSPRLFFSVFFFGVFFDAPFFSQAPQTNPLTTTTSSSPSSISSRTQSRCCSAGTWDVHGAHPVSGGGGSFNAGPFSYGDAEIQEKIKKVNAVANAAGSYSVAAPSTGAAERAQGARAAIEAARAPIAGTKASSEAWAQAARAAAGVPNAPAAVESGDKANNGSDNKPAANSNKPAANNSNNNKPAADNKPAPSKNAAANTSGKQQNNKTSPNKADLAQPARNIRVAPTAAEAGRRSGTGR
jgi:hypothetical protein